MALLSDLSGHNQSRWQEINREQDENQAARAHKLTVAERLDRGLSLSRTAVALRRAAREALHGHPAT